MTRRPLTVKDALSERTDAFHSKRDKWKEKINSLVLSCLEDVATEAEFKELRFLLTSSGETLEHEVEQAKRCDFKTALGKVLKERTHLRGR